MDKQNENLAALQVGEYMLAGCLGEDQRSYAEITRADAKKVAELGLNNQEIAKRLGEISQAAADIYEREILLEGRYRVTVRTDRGPATDPFGGDPSRKGDTVLRDEKTGIELRWNELSARWIKERGFFSGCGSPYRLDPENLAKALF